MSAAEQVDPLLHYREDPVGWIDDVLGRRLWSKQAEIARALVTHREVAVASCHAAGKSHTGAALGLWSLYNFPMSMVLTTAPTQRQVEGILWKEMRALHRDALFDLGGRVLTSEIQIDEDWQAIGFTAIDADRFQGFHAPSVTAILDEAAGITHEVHVGVDAVLSGGRARKLMIGNPTDPTSEFAAAMLRDDVAKFSISAFDTPNFTGLGITLDDIKSGAWRDKIAGRPLPMPSLITPEWVADKFKKWGEDSPLWLARIMAKFPTLGANQLVPLAWWIAAVERAAANAVSNEGPKILSCDVARYGDDETVIGFRQGRRYVTVDVQQGQNTMETVGKLVNFRRQLGADEIRVDVIGVGGGVVDRLEELRQPVVSVNVAEAAIDNERCRILRDEIYVGIRDRMDPRQVGGATIEVEGDEELAGQLTQIRFRVNSRGQTEVESKDEMKKRGLSSPDRADAFAIAFANVGDTAISFY